MDYAAFLSMSADSVSLSTLLGYVQHQPESILILNGQHQPIYINDHAKSEIAHYTETLGEHYIVEAMARGQGTELTQRLAVAAAEGKPTSFEARLDWIDAWYEIQVTPLEDNIVLRFRNISDRWRTQAQLRTAEERYRLASKATNDLIWDLDLVSGHLAWGEALHHSFGHESANLESDIGWWKERIHPVDRTRVVESLEDVLETGGNHWRSKYRFLCADSSYMVVSDRGFVIRDGEGQAIRMVGAMSDLTGDKRARQELARTRTLSHSIVAAAQIKVHVIDADGTVIYEYLFGSSDRPQRLALGESFYEQLGEQAAISVKASVARVVAGLAEDRIQIRAATEDGREGWFELTISPIVLGQQEPRLMISALDVTSLKHLQQSLRETQLVHQSILEASADCIMILDVAGQVVTINEPGLRMLEIAEPAPFYGRSWAALWPEAAHQTIEQALHEANANRVARFSDCAPTALGTLKWWDVVVTPMTDDAGDVVRILAVARDITSAREHAEEVRWASEHDPLTSLPNRRSFDTRLRAATVTAVANGTTVGLLLIDLDHFKHINDSLGHAAGDFLLCGFARRLRSCVGNRGFVARMGGDEFAVVVENVDCADELTKLGGAILNHMQRPFAYEERVIVASASMGGALFPQDAASGHELVRSADIALYALKEGGRGGTRMFHSRMREEAQLVVSQLSIARTVLRKEVIVPFYQPKVDLRSGAIVGFEALLRWQHRNDGPQLPHTIAAGFREYDLASRMGEMMYTRVLADMARWREAGVDVGRISINAAPAEFLRDNYAERLLGAAQAHGVPPDALEIDVTEEVLLDRASQYAVRALRKLQEGGTRIALDDFGTGHSSLSHLRDAPVDVVKIDRSLISGATEKPELGSIVTAIVNLARSLSLEVVAEGIETEAQRAFLTLCLCHQGQGFLFGRAMPASAVTELIGTPSGQLAAS